MPDEAVLPLPDARADRGVAEPGLLGQLAPKRRLLVLAGLERAAGGRPERAPARRRERRAGAHGRRRRARGRGRRAASGGSSSRRSSSNQCSRSAYGTAAFAGDVDGRTKSSVSTSRRSCSPSVGPLAERAAVRLLADERDRQRRELAGDALQALGRAGEVGAPQVARARRRAERRVRDAVAERGQLELLLRREQTRGQAGVVEQAPEVVARIREVRAGGRRDASRVDAAEDARRGRARARRGSRSRPRAVARPYSGRRLATAIPARPPRSRARRGAPRTDAGSRSPLMRRTASRGRSSLITRTESSTAP